MTDKTTMLIFLVLWGINFFIPLLILATEAWASFTFRKDMTDLFIKIQKFKWGFTQRHNFGITDAVFSSILAEGIVGFLVMMTLGLLTTKIGFGWVACVAIILSAVYIPRFIVDITKSLAYNRKTGEAERLDKLQKEIEEIKARQNERGY